MAKINLKYSRRLDALVLKPGKRDTVSYRLVSRLASVRSPALLGIERGDPADEDAPFYYGVAGLARLDAFLSRPLSLVQFRCLLESLRAVMELCVGEGLPQGNVCFDPACVFVDGSGAMRFAFVPFERVDGAGSALELLEYLSRRRVRMVLPQDEAVRDEVAHFARSVSVLSAADFSTFLEARFGVRDGGAASGGEGASGGGGALSERAEGPYAHRARMVAVQGSRANGSCVWDGGAASGERTDGSCKRVDGGTLEERANVLYARGGGTPHDDRAALCEGLGNPCARDGRTAPGEREQASCVGDTSGAGAPARPVLSVDPVALMAGRTSERVVARSVADDLASLPHSGPLAYAPETSELSRSRCGDRDEGGPAHPAAPATRFALERVGDGARYALAEGPVVIGRSRTCDISIAGNGALSRRHARVDAGAGTIEDLGSANGTFVGGVRLPAHRPVPLAAGESFMLANETFRLRAE